jgi:hypothetical protein
VALFKSRWPAGLFAFLLLFTVGTAWAADAVHIKFHAVSAQGASPLKENLKWVIEPTKGTKGETIKATKPRVEADLVPGSYKVTVTMGLATVTQPVTISKAGKQEIVLNTGYASFRMIPSNKAKPIDEQITWTIFRFTKGGPDLNQKVGEVVGPNPQVTLPAGFYTVRGKYDGVQADMVAEVKPGIGYKYTVNLYAGKAALSASAKGKPAKDVTWKIMKIAKNKKGQQEVLYTSTETSPTVVLREGNYIVTARSGDMAAEAKLAIAEGKTNKMKLELKEGVKVAAGS